MDRLHSGKTLQKIDEINDHQSNGIVYSEASLKFWVVAHLIIRETDVFHLLNCKVGVFWWVLSRKEIIAACMQLMQYSIDTINVTVFYQLNDGCVH